VATKGKHRDSLQANQIAITGFVLEPVVNGETRAGAVGWGRVWRVAWAWAWGWVDWDGEGGCLEEV
jgi:hypothetical protein